MHLKNRLLLNDFSSEQKKFVILSSLSSGLEYYDFILFIIFAKVISQTFFTGSAWLDLMATFAVFAVGYFGRPLGAIIFGHVGDRFGRKKSFVMTAILMALSSLFIGLLPGYATLGIAAPIVLLLLRIVQGLSLGGELSGSLTYSIEIAPQQHRAFTMGLIFLGVNIGILFAYAVSYGITHATAKHVLGEWGWRIAYLIGGGMGVINFYLRRVLKESPVFIAQEKLKIQAFPVAILLHKNFKKVLQGMGLVLLGALSNTIFFYLPTYLALYFHFPLATTLMINSINIVILTLEQIFLGAVSDRYGRKRILMSCAVLYLILAYPLFKLLALGTVPAVVVVLFIFAVLNGLAGSCYPTMLAELFPTEIRYSGFAFSYNVSYAVFAGLSPFLMTYFIHVTGSLAFPGIYLSIMSILAIIAIATVRDRYQAPL